MILTKNRREPSRITKIDLETCSKNVGNKFDFILIAAARAREIQRHNRGSLKFEHLHNAVTASLEVQDGKIGREYLRKV